MSTPTPILDSTLTNDGFWPDIVVREVVEAFRLQTDARDQMLARVLLEAMIQTNDALQPAKTSAKAGGYADLAAWAAANPGDNLNGEPASAILYGSAIGNLAKAKLVKRRQDQQRRPIAETETLGAESNERYFLDEHQAAVAGLMQRLTGSVSATTNYGAYVASLGD